MLGQKILSCVVVAFFGLIGLALIRVGIADLILFNERKPFLIKLPGRIVEIVTERETRTGTPNSRTDTGMIVKYIPLVDFTTPQGETVRFRSDVVEIHELRRDNFGLLRPAPDCKWTAGQAVEVTFDPGGVLKPFFGGGMGGSGIGWAMIAAGLVALGASVGLGFIAARKAFR